MIVLIALVASAPAVAQEAWLVTYGPGADAWSRFGHNAVMIRDRERGIERNYAFGYFDMERPGFLTDFLRGYLVYEGHPTDAPSELSMYRARDRSVRKQRLNLDEGEVRKLHALLEENVRPGNRAYEYDYYFNNCSTRIRDLIDQALDGALEEHFSDQPARLNLRDHTHRVTQDDFWLHTGLMLVLGPGIDGARTAWEEMFLPQAMADQLAGASIDGAPLVIEDQYWHESERYSVAAEPRHRWGSYALLGLATAVILLVPSRMFSGRVRWWPLKAFALVNALAGTGLLLLWVASEHDAIWRNAVLLLLNPLWVLLLLPGSPSGKSGLSRAHGRTGTWFPGRAPGTARLGQWLLPALGLLTLAGALVLSWPEGYQYRPAPLLWLVPANLAALTVATMQRHGGRLPAGSLLEVRGSGRLRRPR